MDVKQPPISDYGYIGDCHSAALVSAEGSIDWCCMPRVDSPSCFGRILDWECGGYCQITVAEPHHTRRRYQADTLMLETSFVVDDAEAKVIDCFTMREGGQHEPYQQILRVIEGVRGRLDMNILIEPRFDYGAIKPWIRQYRDQHIAIGGSAGLLISGDLNLKMSHRHKLNGQCTITKGERRYLSILYRKPETLDEGLVEIPAVDVLKQRLQETMHWWQRWIARGKYTTRYAEPVRRSAIVLKALSNAPTGAIAAAPTTSLPETIGGSRNWDYRFSWVRDSAFTVRALSELGHGKEAIGFRRFIERSAAGNADELQVLYGVGGERRLHEQELAGLAGYRCSSPVRIGNAAEKQEQLDVYGELLMLSWEWHDRGHSPDENYWEFLRGLVDVVVRRWNNPDRGIWEMRGEPRHFVQSKAMCWAALDRGLRLAESLGYESRVHAWRETRHAIEQAIMARGYDQQRGIFTQAFDVSHMDASLLLLPLSGFVTYTDARMQRTTDAIIAELSEDGLLKRYPCSSDGLDGDEGLFLACSFWLAECLARQGRSDMAHTVFKRALEAGNDLGLFSEEYDVQRGALLGNFPQGLTHLSLITAALALDGTEASDNKVECRGEKT